MENQEIEQKQEKKPVNNKKTILSILIVLIITAVVFVILFSFNDFNKTIDLIKTVNGVEMGKAVLCLVIYAILWPMSLCFIAKQNHFVAKFFDVYLIGESEHFFNAITPFATGGQPVQVYLFTQKQVKASDSTGIIVSNFIAFMIASNIYAIASLVFYGKFSENFNASTAWMIGLGFAMNLFTLVFMILVATSKKIRDILKKLMLQICKIKFIGKHLSKAVPAFEKYCENAQSAAKRIFSHKTAFIGAILLKMLALLFYYAIPYYILKALGADFGFKMMPYIILASAFAITTMVWVPTPGGTGGIEFAFKTIFTASLFGALAGDIGFTGMILWRALTYYLLMILSAIAYIVYEILVKRYKKKETQSIQDSLEKDNVIEVKEE
ncbi:MAG: flippase-like domain-containing protein [Roseburia sp.]|nr:flippase-like domain-containing protein [Anaeroplasma bactoclasticum]MCM1195957.1 flippase-like domain-containing protein [Roseburia sp.]MCM1555901.1 flippase-like domain-containing protein [Anaeroplasma bactoclasticum]